MYYNGVQEEYVKPASFKTSAFPRDVSYDVWEWCAGSASLSSVAKEERTSHLPPVDFRYGWDIGRVADQLLLFEAPLVYTIGKLFASPNCAPWGNHTRGLPPLQLAAIQPEDVLISSSEGERDEHAPRPAVRNGQDTGSTRSRSGDRNCSSHRGHRLVSQCSVTF